MPEYCIFLKIVNVHYFIRTILTGGGACAILQLLHYYKNTYEK
ncbi:hypothetical protein MMC2321_00488 [Chitinophaga sp. MM2321]